MKYGLNGLPIVEMSSLVTSTSIPFVFKDNIDVQDAKKYNGYQIRLHALS